jgi:hypothetical protein
MTDKITGNILRKLEIPGLVERLTGRISFGELQSLLLRVFEQKINHKNCSDILREYESGRFTKPSDIHPLIQRKLELALLSLLPEGFELIDLSPLAPLGTTPTLTNIHPNNVVSTIRNTEVAADTTNVLALECALRRRELLKSDAKCAQTVKLCAGQRLTRAQPFENKNFSAHFNVVALCSAGRDEGNNRFEMVNLEEHIRFYIRVLDTIVDRNETKGISIRFFSYKGFDNERLTGHFTKLFSDREEITISVENESDFGKNYYTRLRFMIGLINPDNQEFDYIDGGFTEWTARLLNNQKERLLTSGIGTDYLLRTVKYNFQIL